MSARKPLPANFRSLPGEVPAVGDAEGTVVAPSWDAAGTEEPPEILFLPSPAELPWPFVSVEVGPGNGSPGRCWTPLGKLFPKLGSDSS